MFDNTRGAQLIFFNKKIRALSDTCTRLSWLLCIICFVKTNVYIYMYFNSIEKMVRTKISDKVEGIVLGLLETNRSYRSIQKDLII
jgi:hypothetical protein